MAIFGKKKKTEVEDKKQTETKVKDVNKKSLDKSSKGKTKEEVEKPKTVDNKNNMGYKYLIKPLITEKAANLGINNQYVFIVSNDANKIEIKKAITAVYGVKAVNVNIINNEGKIVRRGRYTGKRKDFKKAIITIEKGKSLNIYEGV